jgi:hypothetical protein
LSGKIDTSRAEDLEINLGRVVTGTTRMKGSYNDSGMNRHQITVKITDSELHLKETLYAMAPSNHALKLVYVYETCPLTVSYR